MKHLTGQGFWKPCVAVSAQLLMAASLVLAVEPTNSKTFTAGEKAKINGVILSRTGDTLKVRSDDNTIDNVDVSNDTKIELRKSWASHSKMDTASLVPGLHITAEGKGGSNGDLVASKVTFDPNSMKATRQIDARVSPLEARTNSIEGRAGQLESRAGTLENRAGQIEGRQNDLESTEKQTQQQVAQVKTAAEQGINAVNSRVGNLDNYTPKESATVYFRSGSAVLTPQAKQDLDKLAQQAKAERGFVIEVTGYADTTGSKTLNQQLSDRRSQAVIQYLEEQGDIPVHRILPPTGLGTTHEVADNKTSSGRKLNRRVEVKVLVNQGLVADSANGSGSSSATSSTSSATAGNTASSNSASSPSSSTSSTPAAGTENNSSTSGSGNSTTTTSSPAAPQQQ